LNGVSLFAPVLLAAALRASSGGACQTTDLMLAFWSFWDRAKGEPVARQYELFVDLVQKPNAAVYQGVFAGAPKPPAEFVPDALAKVPELQARMRALSSRLAAELPRELDAFRKSFPGFQCSIPVYFVFSGGAFDGATREVSGKRALMFGLDVIARRNEELSPLFVHELFHVYHGQVVPDGPSTVSWGLWEEGLATYVSRKLNPDTPEQKVCCLPPLDAMNEDLPRIAGDLLARLDSAEKSDYARFFLGGQDLDIPARSGYYVGYLVAREAGKTHTLEQLAAMTPGDVRALEEKELRRLAAGRPR
jgi:hypothetical protein